MNGRFGARGGGKRGPKQHNGSFKIHNGSKLRPAPEKPFVDATEGPSARAKGKRRVVDHTPAVEEDEEDEEEEDEFGYREDLRPEQRPLVGVVLSVTGAFDTKSSLLEEAKELGAVTSKTLTIETTHLVAETSGSAKYEMAARHRIKIMFPSWVRAVGEAWRAAEAIDLPALEIEHRMPPLQGLIMTVTAFARGAHKDEFCDFLSLHGASIKPGLAKDTTHLIIAASTSPHSQAPMTDKLSIIKKAKANGRIFTMKMVWEGWAHEVVAHGGVCPEREEFWAWREGESEPVVIPDTKEQSSVREKERKAMRAEASFVGDGSTAMEDHMTSKDLLDIFGEDGEAGRTTIIEDDEPTPVPTKVKARARLRGKHSSVDQLISSYTNVPVASTSNTILPPELVQRRKEPTRALVAAVPEPQPQARGLAMERAEDTGLRMGAKIGKSVIQAISTSRSTSFLSDETVKRTVVKHATRVAGVLDDSAYFEDVAAKRPVEDDEAKQIFTGKTFCLVGMGKAGDIVKRAVEQHGGAVVDRSEEAQVDMLCVLAFSAPSEYRGTDDPRVVTECWIEKCIYYGKVLPPSDFLLDKPLAYDVPVPGAEALDVHLSGYEEVDNTHIKRFVAALGGKWCDLFDRTRSHLVHALIDEGRTPEGPKPNRAAADGIPIRGLQWLKAFGRDAAALRDAQASAPQNSQILSDAVLFLSPKLESVRDHLTMLGFSLGAVVTRSFTSPVTHLVHAGNRASEAFKEFKTARAKQIHIVHPQWLEECLTSGQRAPEGGFPHMFDLKKSHQLACLVQLSPEQPIASKSARVALSAPVPERVGTPTATPRASRPPRDSATPFLDGLRAMPAPISQGGNYEEDPSSFAPFDAPTALPPDLATLASSSSPHLQPAVPRLDAPSSDQCDVAPPIFAVPLAPQITLGTVGDMRLSSNQTRDMMAQLQVGLGVEEPAGRRRGRIGRKRSMAENSTSTMGSTTASLSTPMLLPTFVMPRRIPGAGYSQATQGYGDEEESMCVTYDDPAAAEARKRIVAAITGTAEVNEMNEEGGKQERERKRAIEDDRAEDVVRRVSRRLG